MRISATFFPSSRNLFANEMADFLYHAMVLMAEKGITWDEIIEELDNRH